MRSEKAPTKLARDVNRFLLTVICSLFIIFAFSCQTMQQTPNVVLEEANLVPLDSGAFAYVFVDVKNARPIIDNAGLKGTDDKQFQQILDMTQSAAAAVYSPLNERRFQLAAWGSYPASRAKVAFGSNKDWKKMRSPASKSEYWYSERNQLSVAMGARQAFVAAARQNSTQIIDPFPTAPETAIPEGFNQFRKGAILSLWLENPAPIINKKLAETGIPIELPADQLFIGLFPKDERYEAQIRMQVSSEAQARALTTILAFARGLISNALGGAAEGFAALVSLFFATPPVQDGNTLTVTTAPLSGREIALLFNMFSVQ